MNRVSGWAASFSNAVSLCAYMYAHRFQIGVTSIRAVLVLKHLNILSCSYLDRMNNITN